MTIRRGLHYPMPDDPPTNTVSWSPDPRRAALLIHDMQNYFVDFFRAGGSPVTELVANCVRLREAADRWGIPVFYTAQPGSMTSEERGLLHDFWGPGMSAEGTGPGTPRALIPELALRDGDTLLTKWRYSAFVRSDLDARLRAAGRDQLIICGVYAHVGCLMTASDAFARDVEPFLVSDAVADFSEKEHRMALDYGALRCAAVLPTDRVLTDLDAAVLQTTAGER
ncbi:isochorismatase family protein [Nocardiopsis sp. NPDC006832]|uniref:isochorismatase family protein n=1 Tax=Nocardiopsis sp. NPDC006832 TaxID=3157188 RepID=UPI0033DBB0F5